MSPDYDPHASSLTGRTDPEVLAELYAIRGSIDNIDASLVYLLAERFKFTQRVGALKARHELPPSDPGREAAQIERLHRLALEADLEPAFAEKFLNFIIAEVIRHHRALASGARRGPGGGFAAGRDADGRRGRPAARRRRCLRRTTTAPARSRSAAPRGPARTPPRPSG